MPQCRSWRFGQIQRDRICHFLSAQNAKDHLRHNIATTVNIKVAHPIHSSAMLVESAFRIRTRAIHESPLRSRQAKPNLRSVELRGYSCARRLAFASAECSCSRRRLPLRCAAEPCRCPFLRNCSLEGNIIAVFTIVCRSDQRTSNKLSG